MIGLRCLSLLQSGRLTAVSAPSASEEAARAVMRFALRMKSMRSSMITAMRAAQFNIRSAARNFPLIRSAGMVLSHLNFVAEIEFRQHLHVLRSFGRCTASADCPQESPQAPASTLRTGCRFGCSFYYITSMQKMEHESRQRFDIGEKE
jgi:hypothetical protein